MKITKQGKPKVENTKVEEFTCQNCGCVFLAEEDEYYIEKGSQFTTASSTAYYYSATVTDTYICSCPECHKIVTKTKSRIEQHPCVMTFDTAVNS